ncbi:hypothetical protein [Kitasatospora sp. NPDC093679]|uniref:hypothetical protein n=1 Tax=Kitasatospora sp. NPDC093679 TaxID=3154983 RepID=UPI003441A2FD
MSGHYGPGVGRADGGGCGCAVLLLFPGWFVAGYLLALPAVLPWVMAASSTPQPPLQASQRAVLWAISVFTALLLGWMAGGRGRPRPVALLVRAALIGAAAAGAALAAPAVVRAGLAGRSLGDPATQAAGEHVLAATLGTVASAVATAVCYYVVRWWGRRGAAPAAPARPVHIPVRPRTTVRRPAPGEVWLAEIPLREDRSQALRHYCVVLESHASHATVLQITSQSKDHRDDFVKMPNDGWDLVSGKDHWLELRRRDVPYRQFLKNTPQGLCPSDTWQEIVRAGA